MTPRGSAASGTTICLPGSTGSRDRRAAGGGPSLRDGRGSRPCVAPDRRRLRAGLHRDRAGARRAAAGRLETLVGGVGDRLHRQDRPATVPVECKASISVNLRHVRGLIAYLRSHGTRHPASRPCARGRWITLVTTPARRSRPPTPSRALRGTNPDLNIWPYYFRSNAGMAYDVTQAAIQRYSGPHSPADGRGYRDYQRHLLQGIGGCDSARQPAELPNRVCHPL